MTWQLAWRPSLSAAWSVRVESARPACEVGEMLKVVEKIGRVVEKIGRVIEVGNKGSGLNLVEILNSIACVSVECLK